MTALSKPELVLEPIAHTYTLGDRRLPGISEIIKGAGLVNDAWFTDYSRERGSAAHLACQLYDENDLNEETLDPAIVPYLDAWKKFTLESEFLPSQIEKSLHSPILQFAGTPDRFGFLNGDEVIVEIKTGGISFVTGLQLAAQDILFQHAMNLHAKKRFAVQLTNKGTYKLTQFSDPQDRHNFLACLGVYHCKAKNNLLREAV